MNSNSSALKTKRMSPNAMHSVMDETPSVIKVKAWYGDHTFGDRGLAEPHDTKLRDRVGKDDLPYRTYIDDVALRLRSARTESLNAILDLSPDGFISFDKAQCVSYVSPAFYQMTGLVAAQLMGQDAQAFSIVLARLCLPCGRFAGVQRLRDNATSGGPAKRELIQLLSDKRVLEVGLRLSNASAVSEILYFHDVTREIEVDQMKSNFLSTAAHELRNPMASIFGFAELLVAGGNDAARTAEFLGIIYRQSGSMVGILNELLDLARIEARQGKDFAIEPLSLHSLVYAVVQDFKLPQGRARPTLDLVNLPLLINGDRKKLQQVLLNVLCNAYKYSSADSSVAIGVQALAADAATGRPAELVVRVTDTGIGMTPDQVQRVCEPFYRANASGTVPGTGLGMSIVKEIMDLHHGRIDITSQSGQGTVVSLLFADDNGANG